MTPNLTTSGAGMSGTLARALAPHIGQVNVSIDGSLRRHGSDTIAWNALHHLRHAGVRVGVNTVLTRTTWPELDAIAADLAPHAIAEWQWLRLKPSGRGQQTYADQRLTREQHTQIWPRLLEIERQHGLTLRIDCAMVPFLAMHEVPVAHLQAHGVYGCPGGERLVTRTASGRWLPCSFASDLSRSEPTPFSEAWRTDATFKAWRDRAEAPPEPCASCAYREVCRGGCRIVAGHLTGDPLAPDPECPKVSP